LLSSGTSGTKTEKEITVKIFQNGVFHITGVLDEEYDRDVTTRSAESYPRTLPNGCCIWRMEPRLSSRGPDELQDEARGGYQPLS
jgi:hypothetical protein